MESVISERTMISTSISNAVFSNIYCYPETEMEINVPIEMIIIDADGVKEEELTISGKHHKTSKYFSNRKTWGKRNQTKCKLCGNHETLLHVLNNCSVSLNQGRRTWRHNSILRHFMTTLKRACHHKERR